MKRAIKIFLICTISFYILLGFFAFYLYYKIDDFAKDKKFITAGSDNICIFAAHQDDGIIMACGYAIQTIKNGGSVDVFLMFDGEAGNGRKRNKIRMNESIRAWKLIGIEEKRIHFFDYDDFYGLIDKEEIKACIGEVTDLLRKSNYDIIFVPLYEGGHYQHDIINFIISRACINSGTQSLLYECPEYNAYYSLKYTPEKILSLISRLIPFYEFKSPPSFIRDGNRLYLDMSDEELILKRKTLQTFRSQGGKELLGLYGYKDSFQTYTGYDYSEPPFDYENSVAKHVNNLKTVPVLRSFLWWLFGKTKTRHPDLDYMITKIKIDKEH